VKAIPTILCVLLLAVFIQWVVGKNIEYKRMTWQSDYFIAFMVTLFLFILLSFYEMKLVLRRTLSWFIINNMFKLVIVIFSGLIFAP
jgi:presenilin-like A22 family membrane protease